MSIAAFDEAYRGTPPWQTGEPQPEVVRLAERGAFSGRVLDVGCGSGENSRYLASLGLSVVGVDGSPNAIAQARAAADAEGMEVEFQVADAFDLQALGRRFDTVLDSAFLHVLGDPPERRRAYTDQVAQVLAPGGWMHLLEISERIAEHPTMTRPDIAASFGYDWTTLTIAEARYSITTGEVPAWLAAARTRTDGG